MTGKHKNDKIRKKIQGFTERKEKMKLINKILGKNNKVEQMVREAINIAEDEDIYKAKEKFLSMLEKHPEIRKDLLMELGVRIDDDEQAPNEFLDKVALEITKSKEIPDSVLDDTVSDKLTDEGIKELILKGNMAIFRQELLSEKIQNLDLKKEMQILIEKRREKNQTEALINETNSFKSGEIYLSLWHTMRNFLLKSILSTLKEITLPSSSALSTRR